MYTLNSRLAADIFDGEYIIANLDTGLYYSIQGMAVSLVNSLPFEDHHQIIDALAVAFPENSVAIKEELIAILKELQAEDIIQIKNLPATATGSVVLPTEYVASKFNRYADMQDLLMLDPIHDVDEEGWTIQKEQN